MTIAGVNYDGSQNYTIACGPTESTDAFYAGKSDYVELTNDDIIFPQNVKFEWLLSAQIGGTQVPVTGRKRAMKS